MGLLEDACADRTGLLKWSGEKSIDANAENESFLDELRESWLEWEPRLSSEERDPTDLEAVAAVFELYMKGK